MTREEIVTTLQRYQLNATQDPGGTELFLAWYSELPGCMVEAPDRDAALAELDFQAVPFVERILSDGGRLPLPLTERPRKPITQIHSVTRVVVGNVRELLGPMGGKTVTTLENRPNFRSYAST